MKGENNKMTFEARAVEMTLTTEESKILKDASKLLDQIWRSMKEQGIQTIYHGDALDTVSFDEISTACDVLQSLY